MLESAADWMVGGVLPAIGEKTVDQMNLGGKVRDTWLAQRCIVAYAFHIFLGFGNVQKEHQGPSGSLQQRKAHR
jgi:hypothetical protein